MLYICDHCLDSLLPIYVNDLFVKFGKPVELDRGKTAGKFKMAI
jgi:hypothetical protein